MALRNNNIAVGIDADAANAIKALKDLKGAFTGVKVGAAAGAIAIAAMGAALGSATKKAMEHGAKLELVQSKTAVVFGDQLPMIQKWSQETAGAFGLTAINLEGMAAGFADLLVPMEFTRAEAAEMTTKVVGLAGAFSEWSAGTRTVEDTTRILARAMLGEREMLKDLGVDIRELDIKQRLMAKGQEHLTGNMLKQARATATMEMIFERSKDAQEGFRVGGDNLTRTMREIEAAIKEVVQDVVLGMMPQLKNIAAVIKDEFIPAMQDAGPFFVKLGINLIKVVEGALAVAGAFAKVVSFITPVTDGLTAQERKWQTLAELYGVVDEKTGEFVKSEEEVAAGLGFTAKELEGVIERFGWFNAELVKKASLDKEERENDIAKINRYQDFAAALGTNAEAMQKVYDRTKEVIEAEIRAREETSNLQKAFAGLTNEQVASRLAQELLNASLDDMPFEEQNAMLQSAAESLRAFHETGIKGGSTLDSLRSLIFHMAGIPEDPDDFRKEDKKVPKGVLIPISFNDEHVKTEIEKFQDLAADQFEEGFFRVGIDLDKLFGKDEFNPAVGFGTIGGRFKGTGEQALVDAFRNIAGQGPDIGNRGADALARTLGHQAIQQEYNINIEVTDINDPVAIGDRILELIRTNPQAQAQPASNFFGGE